MRIRRGYRALIVVIFFFTAFTGAHGNTEGETVPLAVADVEIKECEGLKVTQCELAKDLILTLKMGEDLTCEACFISLRALGIAPGEDWSYGDPHKIVTAEEIKEVVLEIQQAYNDGMVRLDGFEAAAGINRFCHDIKGPAAPPPAGTEKEQTEEEGQPPAVQEPGI
jgi:hypothetical protein